MATLQTYLVLVIVMATVPLGVLTSWLIVHEIQASRQQMSEGLQRAAGSLAQLIEREQQASVEALTILASAEPALAVDTGAFQRLMQKLPPLRPSWNRVLLMDTSGRVLMRSDALYRKNGKAGGEAAVLEQEDLSAFAHPRFTGRLVGLDDGMGAWTTRISVPVVWRGRTRHVLAAEIDADSWRKLIADSHAAPDNGYAAIFDAQHRLIARAWHAAAPPDKTAFASPPAPAKGAEAAPAEQAPLELDDPPGGLHKTALPDGSPFYAAWQRTSASGWAVSVGVSAGPMDHDSLLAVLSVVGAGLLSVGLGITLSLQVARRVSEPLRTLVSGGPKALRGDVVVQEIALLREAMEVADAQREQASQWRAAKQVLSKAQARLDDHQHLIELAQEAGDVGFFDHHLGSDRITLTSGLARLLDLESHTLDISVSGWLDRIEPEDAQAIRSTLRQAWRDLDTHLSFKFRTRTEDGAPLRWLFTRLVITYSPQGKPLRMLGVMSDVTTQQLIEQERALLIQQEQKARKEAERANRSKDEFLAMLGHELRNPLSAITAAIEVLNRISTQDGQAVRVRTIISRQTRHLARLMDDLLDVARVVAGKIHLSSQPLNLGATVQRLVSTMRMSGALQTHPLQLHTEDGCWVNADVVRVEQIVNNLVANAVKYSPGEQPIEVRVRLHEGMARLQVTDHGPGIVAGLLPHVFDLFVQGERTLDRRQGGLGIGLTLVKNLVELQRGRIDVHSSDQGSTFTVDLPLCESPEHALNPVSPPPAAQRHVVVVEDNDDAREALCCMLELKGHKVWAVSDGIEGLARITEVRPHLALVDIGLPGLCGYDIAQRAREAGCGCWLVALSGYGQQQDVTRALDAGFDAHMVKPLDPSVLDDYLGRAPRSSPALAASIA